jgi:DNA (cytosine-5)-methyltransferase 1
VTSPSPTLRAYYNEIDPFCCAWLSNLMDDGLITPGKIDQRSIEDVRSEELKGYDRCHFFAGIGIWDRALTQRGWQGPIWTGSCPCQPFSAAGKGGGADDPRHLWPAWFKLIRECSPEFILGEQVSAAIRHGWIDAVQADLEGAGYACGYTVLGAHSVGAPHIRQRLYWMANSDYTERRSDMAGRNQRDWADTGRPQANGESGAGDEACGLALSDGWDPRAEGLQRSGEQRLVAADGGDAERLGDAKEYRRAGQSIRTNRESQDGTSQASINGERPNPTNGLWRDPDWLFCRDGKWRPVRSGTFPLAHAGTYRNRVALLRGAGNAICLAQAEEFILAVMEVLGENCHPFATQDEIR